MKIPKRYISLNTNVAWEIEGAKFESIDLKYIEGYQLSGKKITIDYLCSHCEGIHTTDYYPNTKSIHTMHLLDMMLDRRLNEWAKYKEKVELYQYKYSKKETIVKAFQTMMMQEDEEDTDTD